MARLVISTEDFDLEFDSPGFAKANGRALKNIDQQSHVVSFYATEGCPATIVFQENGQADVTVKESDRASVEAGKAFFFDNVIHNVFLQLKNGCKEAKIRHAAKIVEDELSTRDHGKIVHGAMDFGNDVGRYDFAFSYKKGEELRSFVFTFEVLSQKLDYHEDWRQLVEDIEARYPMLAYDYLKRTYHAFGRSTDEDGTKDLIWWSLFKQLQTPFVKACQLIIQRPKRRLRGVDEFRRADQLQMLTPQNENEFAEHRSNPGHLYRVECETGTHDTVENRFIKHALREVLRKYSKLRKALLEADQRKDAKKLSETAKDEMAAMEATLVRLKANPFFRGVGPFTGLRQQSLTLQRAPGYSTVYRAYAILNAAYMIRAGLNRMETKDIADLYEIWCFLKIEEFAEAALPPGTKITPPDATTDDFVKLLSTGVRSTVVFRSQQGVELARVVYNPEIRGFVGASAKSGIDGTITPTSLTKRNSQDPDIVLRLTNHEFGDYALTYLFDAKYRLEDLPGSDVGCPPQDALDQMHRYRDAIYYGEESTSTEPSAYKKEVIGGYILFPGRGANFRLEPPPMGQPDHRLPYAKSITKVNIGAMPLRPNDTASEDAVKGFVAKLVQGKDDLDGVLGRMNAQKGALIPVATATAITEASVYGTYHGKSQLAWIRNSRYYNLPLDAAKTVGITPSNARERKLLALLPPGRNPTEELLVFKIKSFCGIVAKEVLVDETKDFKYPLSCHHDKYFVWELTDDDPITKKVANIRIVSGGQTGVDQGSLEAAVALGLEIGGWAPQGWIAENGTIPSAFQLKMKEYPDQGSNAANYRELTKANVRDSHATLILVEKLPLEGGTKLTLDFAVSIGRSHHVVDMSAANAKGDALGWLRQFLGMSSALVLNVAGPRESKSPGIQAKTKAFLSEVLWEV